VPQRSGTAGGLVQAAGCTLVLLLQLKPLRAAAHHRKAFLPRPTKSTLYFNMKDDFMKLPTLGLPHFCIQHENPLKTFEALFPISELSTPQLVSKVDWSTVYHDDEEGQHFILLTNLNDWSYFIWNRWNFDANMAFAQKVSAALQTTVNYYFVDSHTAISRWILADKGLITRAHFEGHGESLFDSGFSALETELRATIPDNTVESIFWDLYGNTCQSLEYVNTLALQELTLYTGRLHDDR
jgi:hypothetical protein